MNQWYSKSLQRHNEKALKKEFAPLKMSSWLFPMIGTRSCIELLSSSEYKLSSYIDIRIHIRMVLNVFVSLFYKQIRFFSLHPRMSASPSICVTPTSSLPMYRVLGLKIRVSTEYPKFSRNPNFDHIFSSQLASSRDGCSDIFGLQT